MRTDRGAVHARLEEERARRLDRQKPPARDGRCREGRQEAAEGGREALVRLVRQAAGLADAQSSVDLVCYGRLALCVMGLEFSPIRQIGQLSDYACRLSIHSRGIDTLS